MKKSEFHVKYVKWNLGVASKTATRSAYLVALTLATILALITLGAYVVPDPVIVTIAVQFLTSKRFTHTPYLAPLAAGIGTYVDAVVAASI